MASARCVMRDVITDLYTTQSSHVITGQVRRQVTKELGVPVEEAIEFPDDGDLLCLPSG